MSVIQTFVSPFHNQQYILSICQHSLSLAELITQIHSIWPDLQYHFKTDSGILLAAVWTQGRTHIWKKVAKKTDYVRAEQSVLFVFK